MKIINKLFFIFIIISVILILFFATFLKINIKNVEINNIYSSDDQFDYINNKENCENYFPKTFERCLLETKNESDFYTNFNYHNYFIGYPECTFNDYDTVIPKIIHQFSNKELFKKYNNYHEKCKKINNNWLFKVWDDNEMFKFINMSKNDNFKKLFYSYSFDQQRYDIFRYFLLYQFGGIYIDIDYECIEPFDNYINQLSNSVAFIKSNYWYSIHMIISTNKNKLWTFILNNLDIYKRKYLNYGKYYKIIKSSGPDFITNIMHNGRFDVCGLNDKIFNSCNYCNKKCSKNSFMKHHYNKGWNDKNTKIKNFIVCEYKTIIIFLIIIMLIYKFLWKKIKNKIIYLKKMI